MLAFAAENEQPVIAAAMIKAERLTCKNMVGVDMKAPRMRHDDPMNEIVLNQGSAKMHPGGPTCAFRNKAMPALVACSPSGGMTGSMFTT